MTIREMSLDQLRDWHAKREGWNPPGTRPARTGDALFDAMLQTTTRSHWWKGDTSKPGGVVTRHDHPHAPTLDGADAAFPEGWNWYRQIGPQDVVWEARNDTYHHILRSHLRVVVLDTGDKITDLYRLAALAREAETKGTQ